MSLLYSPSATATVAANTNSISVAGLDLNAVLQGMTISLGARGKLTGDAYIIASVTPSGTNGGTLTTVDPVTSAFTNAGFVIDTRDFNGTAPNYLIASYTQVLNALLRLTSPLTNLFSGSKQVALDKDSAGAISRLLYAIAGRTWAGLEQRTLTYTPAGGSTTSAEVMALRAYPDGTTPSDAILVDLTTGGADVQVSQIQMAAGSTVDLGAVPAGKVLLSGTGTIASFGTGKHKQRYVRALADGAVLTHNATTLVLPGGQNITLAAGDWFLALSDASGNWRVPFFARADGTPLIASGVRTDITQALTATQQQTARANIGAADVSALAAQNLLTNGFFNLSQEFADTAVPVTYPTFPYASDGWVVGTVNGGAFSAQRVSNPFPTMPGIPYGERVTVTTAAASIAADNVFLANRLEGLRLARVMTGAGTNGPMTIAFVARSSVPLTFYARYANNVLSRAYNKRLTIAANTDTFFTYTIPADTVAGSFTNDNGNRGSFQIILAQNSAGFGSADTWNSSSVVSGSDISNFLAAVGSTFIISGVVLLPGVVPITAAMLPLLARPFEDEQRLCQRYYEKSYEPQTVPGTATENGGVVGFNAGSSIWTANSRLNVRYTVPKRALPSVTIYGLSTSGKIANENGVLRNADVYAPSMTAFDLRYTDASASAGIFFHYVANARL